MQDSLDHTYWLETFDAGGAEAMKAKLCAPFSNVVDYSGPLVEQSSFGLILYRHTLVFFVLEPGV
jgi:hypothetical protein